MIRTNRDRLGNSSCRCNPLTKTLAFAIELGIFSCRGYGKLVVAIHVGLNAKVLSHAHYA